MEKKIEEGVLHEKNIIKQLKVVEVKAKPIMEAFNETLSLMGKGEELIYQGVLIFNNFIGRPDLLRKVNGKSRLGAYYYTAEDIKLGHHIKEEYKLQIAFYNFLLGKIQGRTPKKGAVILWNGSKEEFGIDGKRFEDVLADIKEIASGEKKEPVFGAVCRECAWGNYCLDHLKKKEDISLVYRLNRNIKELLNAKNISTLSELADARTSKRINGIGSATLQKFRLQAKSLLENKPIRIAKTSLPKKKLEIFFDMEGDTVTDASYLFGLLANGTYNCFLAKTADEEKKAWKEFIDFFRDRDDFVLYHYGSYERQGLRKLRERYGCDEKTYRKITANMLDIYRAVLRSFILPVYSYSIKDVAKYLGFSWKNEKAKGTQSMFWYSLWLETKDKKWLDLITEYNQDDCRATNVVKDWIAQT